MTTSLRQSTLQTLGLGNVLDIFRNGQMPLNAGDSVNRVFGSGEDRGSLVISGINGIVGAGKAMQLGARLEPFGVPIVGLDFPGAADGIGRQYQGLRQTFGATGADRIMSSIVRLSYDGKDLPPMLKGLRPRFLLEAIPEILNVKKAHYELFRKTFPEIEIRSVTSGFPSSELGVGVAHPSFPHEINKIWEIVEPSPSAVTQMLWALGLVPVPVADRWSFILDVLFCGLTLAALRFHQATNMPFWKVDKYVRRLIGANPFRVHDAIGAKGANFLTWSCLHHLAGKYGELFQPTAELEEHRQSGQDWYPQNHFRPIVNWSMAAKTEDEFQSWILGPLFQMTSLMLHEERGHLAHINAIGELCAQFRRGVLAEIRARGADDVIKRVEAYHKLHPSSTSNWFPAVFSKMDSTDWQQLYVNAEHDGTVGIITISRESYNNDVDKELNRAVEWLKSARIKRVILTGDFHLSTQMIGADISDFFPALGSRDEGCKLSARWSQTARRLHSEFEVSVGFVYGKRCLGGFLELLMHCHYLIAVDTAQLGMPEVTLPVVPGMEGCHWPFRKTKPEQWPRLLDFLLTGKSVKARDGIGWLLDSAGTLDETLKLVWSIVSGQNHGLSPRKVVEVALSGIPASIQLPAAESPEAEAARKAILDTIRASTGARLNEALEIQAGHSADFMLSPACKGGRIGQEYAKVMVA
jgi:enoyl-CoA hydratase/carnithine racemase